MPVIALASGTPTANVAVPEVAMGETYRLEGEEETCEAAHEMRDELELQLILSKQARLESPVPRQAARTDFARKPAIQRSRRT